MEGQKWFCWEVENTIAFYCYNCHLKIKQSAFIQQQYVTKKQVFIPDMLLFEIQGQ